MTQTSTSKQAIEKKTEMIHLQKSILLFLQLAEKVSDENKCCYENTAHSNDQISVKFVHDHLNQKIHF